MLCIVITGPSLVEARAQVEKARQIADFLEFRLDLLAFDFFELLHEVREKSIVTLSHLSSVDEALIKSVCRLNPFLIDIGNRVPNHHFTKQHWMVSSHHYDKFPDLEAILEGLLLLSANYYKIAVKVDSILETFKLLEFAKKVPENVLVMAMGHTGEVSRILGPVMKTPWTYACLEEPLVEGQVSAKTLLELYRFRGLSADAQLYGLIGDPIDQSISHIFHNQAFKKLNHPGVYLKFAVKKRELSEFLSLMRNFSFRGFSVTMPHKEAVIPYLDHLTPEAEQIGAVNTLIFDQGKWIGDNTDGIGALEAIQQHFPVKGRRCLLLGAGGASRAIAYTLLQHGSEVIVVGRDPQKLEKFSQEIGCRYEFFHRLKRLDCDLLINTTPHPMPIDHKMIHSSLVIMDIKTQDTELMICAKSLDCRLIYGEEMFIQQALWQHRRWGLSTQVPFFAWSLSSSF